MPSVVRPTQYWPLSFLELPRPRSVMVTSHIRSVGRGKKGGHLSGFVIIIRCTVGGQRDLERRKYSKHMCAKTFSDMKNVCSSKQKCLLYMELKMTYSPSIKNFHTHLLEHETFHSEVEPT